MDVKEIKRGEVYYVTSGDDYYAIKTGRPAVIISSDFGLERNKNTVMVLFLTTNLERNASHYVRVTTTPRTSLVNCSEVYTIDRKNVGDYLCTLNEWEMQNVDEKLSFCLGLIPPYGEDEETDEGDCEEVYEDDSESVIVERDLYKRLYEKVLEQLVELKFSRECVPPAPIKETVEVVAPAPKEKKPKPVISGGKANVNIDTAQEISDKAGICIATSRQIVSCRKKFGNYEKLEDLLVCSRIGHVFIDKYRDKLEV